MIELRPYQTDFVEAIRAAFRARRRVLGVASTGAGKTVCFAYIATNAAAKGNRITIVAHRAEIVEQISRALDQFALRHGRIMPGHPMTDDPVQVAMVQTVGRRLDRLREPDLLVVDEAHHSVAGSYRLMSDAWQHARILGVTATPRRLDGRGLGDVFDTLVEAIPMADLIRGGFLAVYDYLAPPPRVDLSGVRTRLGDYAVDDLAAAMDRATVTGDAVQHYRRYLDGRPAIAFCVTVAHAEHTAEQFRAAGYNAASVDGKMDKSERRDRIAAIGDGRLQVLTSCELISEGVDVPSVAGAILLRPTKSLSAYLQQVGRVLRPKPDGSRALMLDHVGNVHRHGMPDAPREWTLDARPKKQSDVSTATCEQCYRVFLVRPNWKAELACNDIPQPAGCILADAPTPPRELPEQVDGELVAISTTAEWSDGIDLIAAKGDQFKRLLRLADTPEKLREIARVRGYHPNWVRHVERYQRPRDAEVPFTPSVATPPVRRPAPANDDALADVLGA